MLNLFRIRVEAAEGLQNRWLTFLDPGEADRDAGLAVIARWRDRRLKPSLDAVFHAFVREYRDSETIVSPGAFLEGLVQSLEAELAEHPPELKGEFDLGVVLACGRGLYVLSSRDLDARLLLEGEPQPLQSSLRVRVKDLSPGQEHPGQGERLRLLRVFFEDEDRAVVNLSVRNPDPAAAPGLLRTVGTGSPRIEATKEVSVGTEPSFSDALMESTWPDFDDTVRRDRSTLSYVALGLVAVLVGTAAFGMWRWQQIGPGSTPPTAMDSLFSESVDTSLESRDEAHRVSGEVLDDATGSNEAPGGTLRIVWSKQHEGWVTSSPQLANQRIVYGCRDGLLYAVDHDGTVHWSYDSGSGIGATPAVDNDRVYCGNYAGRAFALRQGNGEELWVRNLGARLVASPALGKKLVFFATHGGQVVALHKKDGTIAWKHTVGGKLRATPAIGSDHLLVSARDRGLVCLSLETGKVRWTHRPGPEVYSAPLVIEDRVVYGCSDGTIHAVSLENGTPLWSHKTQGPVQATPSAGQGLVYVGSCDNKLYALETKTGAVAWTFPAQASILCTPSVQDGKVYLTAYDSHAYVLEAKTGQLVAKRELGAPVYSSPLVVQGHIYCGSNDGTLYCMRDE